MKERHALWAKESHGLNYEFFYGIDKATLNLIVEATKGLYSNERYLQYNKNGNQMRLGVYCCAYGHRAIYQDMILHNVQRALYLK